MPIKRRHNIYALGLVSAASASTPLEVSSVTRGILYIHRAVTGCIVTVEASPDGTNWYPLYDANESLYTFTLTTLPRTAWHIPITSKWIRFAVTVQDATGIWFEGIREIA